MSPCIDEIHELIRLRLRPRFGELARFRSMPELESSGLYRELESDIRLSLDSIAQGDFRRVEAPAKPFYRFVAWNIERGTQLAGQLELFRANEYMKAADVVLLVEADVGMARSGNVDITRTMAQELGYCYAFAPCYLSLVKGSGVEKYIEGDNEIGLHGNAILSRYPIRACRAVTLPNGIDKFASREKRLGAQKTLIGEIEFPDGKLTAVSAHLDAQSTQRHRVDQMRRILDAVEGKTRVVLGGDWNTSTYNSSHAFHAIMGFCLRVLMGVDNVIRNHYLHPERHFEKELFRLLEARGYDYRKSNRMGEHTTYYHIEEPRANQSLGDWVPAWCFPFIRWSLRNHGGRCPLKLDWFATRGVRPENPLVLHEARDGSTMALSDHDAIGVDIRII